MLGRVRRFIAEAVISGFVEFAESPEGQKYLMAVADDLVDREFARIQGSIGGTMKGKNAGEELDFSKAGLIKMFLGGIGGGNRAPQTPLNTSENHKLTI